jgi:hypothetical protein
VTNGVRGGSYHDGGDGSDDTRPGFCDAVLGRASGDAGDSILTIARSDTVCRRCTY